jgi:FkbM family methyltransferase
MSQISDYTRKVATAFRLCGAGDFRKLLVRLRYHLRTEWIQRQAGHPFFYWIAGSRFWCDPGLHDSLSEYMDGPVDLLERAILQLWLKPGEGFIDGGANIGVYSIEGAYSVGPEGVVVAVEPTPALATHVAAAARHMGLPQIRAIPFALSNKAGRADFVFAPRNETAVSQSLVGRTPYDGVGRTVAIDVTTLADVEASQLAGKQPACVKLDIEGAEVMAIEAAPVAWLERDGPLWIVECNPEALDSFGATIGDLIDVFPDGHFEKWIIPKYPPSEKDIHPRPADPANLPRAPFYNLCAIPRGQRWHERRDAVLRALGKGK